MKYIIGLLTAGLLLFGCSEESGDAHNDSHEMHDQAEDHSGHDHGEEGHEGHGHDEHGGHEHSDATSDGITLNNGEKWQADKHTNDKVSEMKKEIANYKESNDYEILTTNLEADVKELIKGCTMVGEPHNQLHYWLEPYLAVVQSMKDASDEVDKSAKVAEIETSLNQYTEYFK